MHLLKSWIYETSSSSSSLDCGVSRCKRHPLFKVLSKVWRLKISHLCTCKLDHASVVDVEGSVAFWFFLWRKTKNGATIPAQSPVLNTSPRSVHRVELAWIMKFSFFCIHRCRYVPTTNKACPAETFINPYEAMSARARRSLTEKIAENHRRLLLAILYLAISNDDCCILNKFHLWHSC